MKIFRKEQKNESNLKKKKILLKTRKTNLNSIILNTLSYGRGEL